MMLHWYAYIYLNPISEFSFSFRRCCMHTFLIRYLLIYIHISNNAVLFHIFINFRLFDIILWLHGIRFKYELLIRWHLIYVELCEREFIIFSVVIFKQQSNQCATENESLCAVCRGSIIITHVISSGFDVYTRIIE